MLKDADEEQSSSDLCTIWPAARTEVKRPGRRIMRLCGSEKNTKRRQRDDHNGIVPPHIPIESSISYD